MGEKVGDGEGGPISQVLGFRCIVRLGSECSRPVGRVLGEEGTWFMHESPCPWLLYRIGRSKRPGSQEAVTVVQLGMLVAWAGEEMEQLSGMPFAFKTDRIC